MQSNSLGSPSRSYSLKIAPDTIPHVTTVRSMSDSLVKYLPKNSYTEKQLSDYEGKIKSQTIWIQQLIRNAGASVKNAQTAKEKALQKSLDEAQSKAKELYNDRLALFNQLNMLIIDKYTSYLKAADVDLDNYKQTISKNRKLTTAGFDTVIKHTNPKYQHIIDSINNKTDIRSEKLEPKLEKMFLRRDTVVKQLTNLKDLQTTAQKFPQIQDEVHSQAQKQRTELNATSDRYIQAMADFKAEFEAYTKSVNSDIDKLNAIVKKMIDENKAEPSDEESLSALGGINNIFGEQGALVHNVSIIAQRKFSNNTGSSFYGDVKLFVGGSNDADKTKTGINKLFVQEASTYGFITDFVFGFIPSNQNSRKSSLTGKEEYKLGINLTMGYLGKKLQPDTLTTFNTSLFHLKIGIQYIIIPHVLSAYINTNQLLVATNLDKFSKYYSDAGRVRSFTSFGIESYLELKKKSDFYLLLNLGFININRDVNTWMNTTDSVIPNIKLSLVKTFNW